MNNPITENWLNDFIRRGIAEDVGDGDHTALACIPSADRKSARLIVKQEGVIAGLTIAEAIFQYLDPTSSWKSLKNEGEYVFPGQIAAGPASYGLCHLGNADGRRNPRAGATNTHSARSPGFCLITPKKKKSHGKNHRYRRRSIEWRSTNLRREKRRVADLMRHLAGR